MDPSPAACQVAPLEAGRLADPLEEDFPVVRQVAFQVASQQVICLLQVADPSAKDQTLD